MGDDLDILDDEDENDEKESTVSKLNGLEKQSLNGNHTE